MLLVFTKKSLTQLKGPMTMKVVRLQQKWLTEGGFGQIVKEHTPIHAYTAGHCGVLRCVLIIVG